MAPQSQELAAFEEAVALLVNNLLRALVSELDIPRLGYLFVCFYHCGRSGAY